MNKLVVTLAVLAIVSPAIAAPEQTRGSASPSIPPELAQYLRTKDLVLRGTIISVQRADRLQTPGLARALSQDGRWEIIVDSVHALRGTATSTVRMYSLATPPPSFVGAPILAYASRTRSDGNRLWGSYFPIERAEDGSEAVVITDNALPAIAVVGSVDMRKIEEDLEAAPSALRAGESYVPYADIVALLAPSPRRTRSAH